MRSSVPSTPSIRARICIVTTELAGPDYNGGIGTANRELALALRAEGHEVDVLYTRVENGRPHCARGRFAEQVERFRGLGIRLMCIANRGAWNDWKGKSRQVMEHLIGHRYDLAMFDDTQGHAYYPLLARRTGCPELAGTKICVVAHSASEWIHDINGYPVRDIAEVRQMEMERRAIELADAVIAPSRYILDKYAGYGWKLPREVHVRPNIMAPPPAAPRATGPVPIDEIVFFGRIETRKGVWNFCRVLDRLKHELSGIAVTFLGKPVIEEGRSTVLRLVRASAGWPFDVNILASYDRDQALAYLKGGRRLAIMPSIEDNSPYAVLECLTHGIPFLASDRGGGGELVAERSRRYCLVAPDVGAVAARLRQVLAEGAMQAEPAEPAEISNRRFLDTVAALLDRPDWQTDPAPAPRARAGRPLLVVLAGRNAGEGASRDIARLARDHGPDTTIFLLAAGDDFDLPDLPENVIRRDAAGFAGIVDEIAGDSPSCVVFCSLAEPATPEWIARAAAFLPGSGRTVALTGVSGNRLETGREILPPYFSRAETELAPRSEPIGNSRALLLLAEESNSGFVAVAPRALALVRELSPWDPQRGCMIAPQTFVHAMLLGICGAGFEFELVPDVAIPAGGGSEFSPVFELGSMVRAGAPALLGDGDNAHRLLLSRLGYETLLSHARAGEGRRFLASLQARYAGVESEAGAASGGPELTRRLARLAHAVGQIGLAREMATQLVSARGNLPGNRRISADELPAYVDSMLRSIDLFKLAENGTFRGINLSESWSLKMYPDDRTLELHANPGGSGRAMLNFPSIDLTGIEYFDSRISLPDADVSPVRFRFELTTLAGGATTAEEATLGAQETRDFQLPIPAACRQPCRVLVSVEMADIDAENRNAYTRWILPRFLAGIAGEANG